MSTADSGVEFMMVEWENTKFLVSCKSFDLIFISINFQIGLLLRAGARAMPQARLATANLA